MFSLFKSKKGFTLVELIVVVAIMGIILAAAVPATQYLQERGKQKDCITNQELLKQKVNDYLNGNYLGLENSLSWKAGSYNPQTDTWENTYSHWTARKYIYYYNISVDKTSQKIDCSPGEQFLRYAYNLKPDVPAVFPSNADGCKVYVEYHDLQAVSYYGRSPLSPEDMATLRSKQNYVPSGYLEIKCTDENHKPASGWTQIPNV